MNNTINDITNKLISNYQENMNNVFTEYLKKNVVPPIDGDITKEELESRNLKMIQQGTTCWLTQNDTQISPKISICATINNDACKGFKPYSTICDETNEFRNNYSDEQIENMWAKSFPLI